MASTTSTPPLTPAVFHILLALSSGERHGYGIMKQVEADSQGKVSMGAGTLYGSLKRMLDAGLVQESDKRVDPEMDDERRIYYQITGIGAQALAAELERYKRIVTLAQEKNSFQKPMEYDQSTIRTLYKRLIAFYPKAFKEQLGKSMEQTFNDLCNEKRQSKKGLFGFVLWTFIETAIGILREHILLIKEVNSMKNMLANPRSAAITSLILSLPLGLTFVAFMFDIEPLVKPLNNLFTIEGQQGDINMLGRIVIYGGLLLLPVAFALNLRPILKREGPEGKRRLYALNLIVGTAILLLITFAWGGLILEQIYCLRGIRCD